MIRFVVVGTLSGALKRPRVLSHDNQAAALARYASDLDQVTERVVWSKGGAPLVVPADYRPHRSELVPAVSLGSAQACEWSASGAVREVGEGPEAVRHFEEEMI